MTALSLASEDDVNTHTMSDYSKETLKSESLW